MCSVLKSRYVRGVQRSSSIALGALAVATLALVLVLAGPRRAPPAPVAPSASPSISVRPPTLAVEALELPSAAPPVIEPEPVVSMRPLPPGAPKVLRFGVILFQYQGAQLAPFGARPKAEALELARAAAAQAKKDWKAAVKRGDPGSIEDAGRISRGILEPMPEVEAFSLAPGAVSDPFDTPRGYWVLKRLE